MNRTDSGIAPLLLIVDAEASIRLSPPRTLEGDGHRVMDADGDVQMSGHDAGWRAPLPPQA